MTLESPSSSASKSPKKHSASPSTKFVLGWTLTKSSRPSLNPIPQCRGR